MPQTIFKILKKDKRTKARLGVLTTPHGKVLTPSYVMVGTYGQIRNLSPADIKKTKTQLIIANTFHLWHNPRPFNFGRVATMTDSGGFQVLSLAFGNKSKVGKFMTGDAKAQKDFKRTRVKISGKGVEFYFNGKLFFLGPALSMKIQNRIGADIIFAFDHITSPLDNYKYNQKAVALTDKWAKICLEVLKRKQEQDGKRSEIHSQSLFGIVQGGIFKDLRIKSAKSIGSMPFDGFGIGGSYTKKQISKILKWIIPYLPEEKPRHLLGVGKLEDILEAVSNGVDTFDCVIPTREARHGRLYTSTGTLDVMRGKFSDDKKIIDHRCGCPTCKSKISRSNIRKLLKSASPKELARGQRYALMHNMWFFNDFVEKIRDSITKGKFTQFKLQFLTKFNK